MKLFRTRFSNGKQEGEVYTGDFSFSFKGKYQANDMGNFLEYIRNYDPGWKKNKTQIPADKFTQVIITISEPISRNADGELEISDEFAEAILKKIDENIDFKLLNGERVVSDLAIDALRKKIEPSNRIALKDSKGIIHDLVFMSDKYDGEFVITSKFMDTIIKELNKEQCLNKRGG